ncbi:hypothetical protein [Aquimarina algiphila]|uniref:hypothetical protein n=1 Tax=Aquimarina algiphila TaxID=2047982 RepID=UPI00232CCE6D|nr:hypothetical protein [Aquimarina algiphila]
MKKLLLSIMLIVSFSVLSQESDDIITLNNGTVIVGKIIEFNFNENLTVQTKEGYGFKFNVQDVRNIKKQQPQNQFKNTSSGQNNFQQNTYKQGYHARNATSGVTGNVPNYNSLAVTPVPQPSSGTTNNVSSQQFQRTVPYHNSNVVPQTTTYNNQNTAQNVPSNQNMQYSSTQHGNVNYAIDPSNSYSNQQNYGYQPNQQQFQNYQTPQQPIQNQRAITPNNNYQAPNNYYSANQNIADTSLKKVPDQDIFTNVDSYRSIKSKSTTIDCSQGFGNFYFVNKTGKNVLISIQKKQKDGYFSDHRELSIPNDSKGFFKDLKTGDHPFFVKVRNSLGNQQNEYTILGRGNIRVEQCKTQQIDIR